MPRSVSDIFRALIQLAKNFLTKLTVDFGKPVQIKRALSQLLNRKRSELCDACRVSFVSPGFLHVCDKIIASAFKLWYRKNIAQKWNPVCVVHRKVVKFLPGDFVFRD